jgi:hypothetical protein
MQREAQLFEIIPAAASPGRLAGLLDGWQQHGDEDADDGNHHQ